MRVSFLPPFARLTALPLLAILSAALTGCSVYKNPLIENEAPPARAQADKPTQPKGLETTQEKRGFLFIKPYRADIQQGNFVSSDMVAQLKPGMTPEQVRFVLGTPLLTDPFHVQRWDYVFELKKGSGETMKSAFTVFFKDGRLERWEGGELPTEQDYLARVSGASPVKTPPKGAQPAAPAAPSTAKENR